MQCSTRRCGARAARGSNERHAHGGRTEGRGRSRGSLAMLLLSFIVLLFGGGLEGLSGGDGEVTGGRASGLRRGHLPYTEPRNQRHLLQLQPQQELAGGPLLYWGASLGYGLVPNVAQRDVIAISSGWRHCVALLRSGKVVVWGRAGDVDVVNVPTDVGAEPVQSIAAGKYHTVVLMASGEVKMWGRSESRSTPPDVAMRRDVASIRGAEDASIVVFRDGTVRVWGDGAGDLAVLQGRLSLVSDVVSTRDTGFIVLLRNGSMLNYTHAPGASLRSIPGVVDNVAAIAASGIQMKLSLPHFLALMSDGTIRAWGGDEFGQASRMAALQGVAAVAAGVHSVALLTNGSVAAYGRNSYGAATVPAELQEAAGSRVVAVSAGENHTMVLLANGSAVAWGMLEPSPPLLPADVDGNVTDVASGLHHSLVLRADGRVVAFGTDFNGETAVPAAAASGVAAVAAGRNHSLVLLRSGRVVSFGALPDEGVPATARQGVTAIGAGWGYSAALLADGSLVVWGTGPAQSCGVLKPPTFSATVNVTAISAGERHMLALLSDGSVRGWGCNDYGQADVSSDVGTAAVAVAAGGNHSLVLLRGGTIVGYGSNAQQQLDPQLLAATRVVAVAAGGASSMLILSDGRCQLYGQGLDLGGAQLAEGTLPVQPVVGYTHALAIATVLTPTTPKDHSIFGSAGAGSAKQRVLIAAIVAAVAVLLAAGAVLGGLVLWRQRLQQAPVVDLFTLCESPLPSKLGALPRGLPLGDPFVQKIACEYSWASDDTEARLGAAIVDEGMINMKLDAELPIGAVAPEADCPVVRLSRQEVVDQVQLLPGGLLGSGATAICFKCVWPSRFGDALLAAKVLKDGAQAEDCALEAFSYEAAVLSSAVHPNIVRLYGYCLEPPTVCLILELLPYSLKDVLYKRSDMQAASMAPSTLSRLTEGKRTQDEVRNPSSNLFASDGHSSLTHDMPSAPDGTTSQDSQDFMCNKWQLGSECSASVSQGSWAPQASSALPRLSVLRVLEIASDIAAGLAYLHTIPLASDHHLDELCPSPDGSSLTSPMPSGCGPGSAPLAGTKATRIAHRDLKPANILLSRTGVAKISDFGLARMHTSTTVVTDHLGAGTLPYMAPELLLGSVAGPVAPYSTNRADVYSLGMIVWEMLAGRQPWAGFRESGIMAMVITGQRPELPSISAGNSQPQLANNLAPLPEVTTTLTTQSASSSALPELISLVQACWAHRDLRRPTAQAVYETLQRLLGAA